MALSRIDPPSISGDPQDHRFGLHARLVLK